MISKYFRNGAGKIWIGITDRDVEGLWEYFDGDTLDVTAFSQYPWEQREFLKVALNFITPLVSY
jgi:hypothetical protein